MDSLNRKRNSDCKKLLPSKSEKWRTRKKTHKHESNKYRWEEKIRIDEPHIKKENDYVNINAWMNG